MAISTSAGKNPEHDPAGEDNAPDPTQFTDEMSDARDITEGESPSAAHDRTKVPMLQVFSDKVDPMLHMIEDFVDTWERFSNALSPTLPFPKYRPQLTLASCVPPVLIAPYFITPYVFLRGISFATGLALFGDPIIARGVQIINKTYPYWKRYFELRHTILRGIPTNAQLAITLLRIGEKNKTPLPPPPSLDLPPTQEPQPKAISETENLGTVIFKM